MEQVDMTDQVHEPMGAYVLQRYDHLEAARVNLPGGLIARVVEAFDNQIQPDGAFIIGDNAINSADLQPESTRNPIGPFSGSGLVAKYKCEDYGLAQEILQSMGYQVELINARDLMDPFLTDAQRRSVNPGSYPDQWVMIVRRNSTRR